MIDVDRGEAERRSAAAGSPSAETQNRPDARELRARLRRLEVLRGAARAMAPSSAEPTRAPPDGAAIGSALAVLQAAAGADSDRADGEQGSGLTASRLHEALAEIDRSLTDWGRELRTVAYQRPLVELRATLPSVCARHRFDVLALLDLLMQDRAGICRSLGLFDYLVTLLSTDERDGQRFIAHDPVDLIPRLKRACEEAASEHGEASQPVEQEFYAAASAHADQADLDALMAQMRGRKHALGTLVFAPGVLRSVVTYNVAIANQLGGLFRSSGDSDAGRSGLEALMTGSEADSLAEPAGAESTAGAGAIEPDARNEGSVFDSPGLLDIALAIRRRVEGESLGMTPEERIAGRADLTMIGEFERGALAGVEDEGSQRVPGLAIAVGMVVSQVLESMLDLREIGIDPQRLQEEWIQELDTALKGVANERIAGDCYKEALAIGDLKTKFLYEPISSIQRRNRSVTHEPTAVVLRIPGAEVRELAESAARGFARSEPGTEAPSAFGWTSWLGAHRDALLGVGAAALLALAVLNVVHTSPKALYYLSPVELSAISTHLTFGYRDGEGAGPNFIGTLGPSWEQLSAADQRAEAERLVRALHGTGVREVMAFDMARRLEIQGASGVLRIPRS